MNDSPSGQQRPTGCQLGSTSPTMDQATDPVQTPMRDTIGIEPGPDPLHPTVDIDSDPGSVDSLAGTVGLDVGVVSSGSGIRTGESGAEFPEVAGYRILGVLGHGGMGVVYRAQHVKLGRVVALKMIIAGAHASPEHLLRFFTEAQAVAHLQHPNIIQIYEVGEQKGLPYFSLEYVDGGSLAEKCARKPQPDRQAASIVETLARAMHYAHQHGVVHRDLKPANILLTSNGEAKITDFGLAKRLEGESSSETRSGAILGTPSYMAPEQARGDIHQIGPLTDVYSLGAMLYELITGRPPFLAANPMDTVLQVIREEPVAPKQLQPAVARDLETICLRCLQKEQGKRYGTAGELAEDLRRFQTGEPITARPVGNIERFIRWCGRNRKIASLTGAVAALLVLTTIGSITATAVIQREKSTAIEERGKAEHNERIARAEQARAEAAEEVAKINESLAKKNEEIAGEQAELALDAFRTVVSEVDKELRDRPAMRPLRTKLLEMALSKVGQVEARAESVPTLERIRAAVFQQKVNIYFGLQRPHDAIEQQRLAYEILERLAASNPEGIEADKARGNLAAALDTLGDLIRGRSPEEARARYIKAREVREDLMNHPQSDFYQPRVLQNFVAGSYAKLGSIEKDLNKHAAAQDYYEQALVLHRRVAAADPNDAEFQESIANTLALQCALSQSLNDWDAARAQLAECMAVRRQLAQKDPQSIRYKYSLAMTFSQMGDMSLFLKDYVVASENYEQMEKLVRQLVEADGSVSYRQTLASVYYRLATAVLLANGPQSAHKYFQQSLEVIEGMNAVNTQKSIGFNNLRMLVLARCGNHESAAKLARELSFIEPQHKWLYQSACGLSLCVDAVAHLREPAELSDTELALRETYREQAIDALGKAIDKGFHDVSELENNPELNALRAVPEFVERLAELKAKAGSK